MIWKVIGQSVIGTSHIHSGKSCEDAVNYKVITIGEDQEALVCFVSDGAGSARFAAEAAEASVCRGVEIAEKMIMEGTEIDERNLLSLAEQVYDHILSLAKVEEVQKNEFSCTLLGFVALPDRTGFLQIGDGAIVRSDESGHLTTVWWPQNGEYQNTTTFLIDNEHLPHLKTKIIGEALTEIAIFTDGLQMLTLNNETESVHQPFFNNLFPLLRKVKEPDHISVLNNRLIDYLSSDVINSRTDDDKTLLLATRR